MVPRQPGLEMVEKKGHAVWVRPKGIDPPRGECDDWGEMAILKDPDGNEFEIS